jgi:predicted transcriptional regulator of viral defense system
MEFDRFLTKFKNKPLILTKDFQSNNVKETVTAVQLSRWVRSGKLIQLKRGYYVLPERYRRKDPDLYYFANNLLWPSYVSLEKALEYWSLIPEAVPVVTSVTTKRPQVIETPLGDFSYRHCKPEFFWGYIPVTYNNETVMIAHPEKALLDLFYYQKGEITHDLLEGLRLQNTEILDHEKIKACAEKFRKPGLRRAADTLLSFLELTEVEYKIL